MIVGGVSREKRFFNFSPITLPVAKVGGEVISLPVPNAPWAAPGPAPPSTANLAFTEKTKPNEGGGFILIGGPATILGTAVFGNQRVQDWVSDVIEWSEPEGPTGQPLAW